MISPFVSFILFLTFLLLDYSPAIFHLVLLFMSSTAVVVTFIDDNENLHNFTLQSLVHEYSTSKFYAHSTHHIGSFLKYLNEVAISEHKMQQVLRPSDVELFQVVKLLKEIHRERFTKKSGSEA